MADFNRPNIPYNNQPLPNDNRYEILTQENLSPPADIMDAEMNYVMDILNNLQIQINGIVAGAIPGSNDPLNASKLLTTDGAGNDSWIFVTDDNIEDNAITTPKVSDAAIINSKLGPASVTNDKLSNNCVTSNNIQDNTIPFAKILTAPSNQFTAFFNTQTNATLSGAKLANASIPSAAYGAASVNTAAIANNAVTNAKLAVNSVATGNIQNAAVTLAKLDPALLALLLPVGMTVEFFGSVAPNGWIFAKGQNNLLIATYPALYALWGTTYGGDGITTFGAPDVRGRFRIGCDPAQAGNANFTNNIIHTAAGGGVMSAYQIGGTGGEENHTLTEDEMPSHGHPFSTTQISLAGGGSTIKWPNGNAEDMTTGLTGGDGTHNNIPPSMFVPVIIFTGVFV